MKQKSSDLHNLVIGKVGIASKSITFKESEFKEENTPINSKVNKLDIDGENYIVMTYSLSSN